MITKLVFKDGIEIVHEDSYPIINRVDDWLDVHSSVDGTEIASYELNSIGEMIFSTEEVK